MSSAVSIGASAHAPLTVGQGNTAGTPGRLANHVPPLRGMRLSRAGHGAWGCHDHGMIEKNFTKAVFLIHSIILKLSLFFTFRAPNVLLINLVVKRQFSFHKSMPNPAETVC